MEDSEEIRYEFQSYGLPNKKTPYAIEYKIGDHEWISVFHKSGRIVLNTQQFWLNCSDEEDLFKKMREKLNKDRDYLINISKS